MTIRQRIPHFLILIGLLLILLWVGLKGWRIASATRSLLNYQEQAETLLAGGLTGLDPDDLEAIALGVRQDVVVLQREVDPFMPLAARLGWMPGLGASLAAAPHLLDMADAGTEALAVAVPALKPTLAVLASETRPEAPLPALMQTLHGAEAELAQVASAMDRLAAARDRIEQEEELPGRVQTLLAAFDERRTLFLAAPRLALVLPDMMGVDGERTYLLLAQNEDELRATGGFISGAGLLHVSGGNFLDVTFQDANLVDAWWEKAYDWPPEPLIELMGLELYLFRDSNFWPDFPTSAEQAIALYQYSQDYGDLDGVIAIDQQFLAMLLGITGPIEIADLDLRINQNNAIDQLRSAWSADEGQTARDWVRSRKDFLGPLAAAMRLRLETNLTEIDPVYLADTMIAAVEEKHLQVYMRDPAVAAVLDQLNWDGRLESAPAQDFLMAVDTNVGYNKSNPLISTAMHYAVNLTPAGDGEANVRLAVEHGGEPDGTPCTQGVEEVYVEASSYEGLITGCYMNYLRVYAPLGSALQGATYHTAPSSAFLNERGWDRPAFTAPEHPQLTTFANFFMLPEGESLETSFAYRLPVVVTTDGDTHTYRLRVMKQAGTPDRPVNIAITLPEGAELSGLYPAGAEIDGQTITFHSLLDRDLSFVITYEQS